MKKAVAVSFLAVLLTGVGRADPFSASVIFHDALPQYDVWAALYGQDFTLQSTGTEIGTGGPGHSGMSGPTLLNLSMPYQPFAWALARNGFDTAVNGAACGLGSTFDCLQLNLDLSFLVDIPTAADLAAGAITELAQAWLTGSASVFAEPGGPVLYSMFFAGSGTGTVTFGLHNNTDIVVIDEANFALAGDAASAPEPSSFLLLGTGLLLLIGIIVRRPGRFQFRVRSASLTH